MIERAPAGTTAGHAEQGPTAADWYRLAAGDLELEVLTYGGHVASITTPDRDRNRANVVLGLPSLQAYEDRSSNPYFGAMVGRYANRIGGSRFTVDGEQHVVDANEGANQLHGGPIGFDRFVWRAEAGTVHGDPELRLHHHSPDGSQGFPGIVDAEVRIGLTAHNALRLDYFATVTQPCPVNLTNHCYFNLGGPTTEVEIAIAATKVVEVDDELIPTGRLLDVKGTGFDLTEPGRWSDRRAEGFDHCFVLDQPGLAVAALDPNSGRSLAVATDQPGVQFYTGIGLGSVDLGFCLETQSLPDSPNHPNFPSTILRPGETYRHSTTYNFGVE